MEVYLRLVLVGLVPVALSLFFYVISKKTFFNNLPNHIKQIIIGVCFGVTSILGTVFGVDVGGAIANARDASPLCAGLLFGGPAGIISGIIGGVYRYIATAWGAGEYSQIACTISTIMAGFFSALLRKYMFDKKRPTWPFGIATAIVMEVFHMTVLFLTHLDNPEKAIEIVEICTLPMIVCTAFALTLSIVLIDLFSKSYKTRKQQYKYITQQIQAWLLLVVVVAYLATTSFVYALQTGTAKADAENSIEIALQDVEKDVLTTQAVDISLLVENLHVGKQGYMLIANSDNVIIGDTAEHNGKYIGKLLKDIGIVDEDYSNDGLLRGDILGEDCFYMVRKCNKVQNDVYFYAVSVITSKEVFTMRDASVYINSYMEVLVFAALFFIVYELIKKKVVNNIRSVNSSLSKIIDGDLNVSVDVTSSEEFSSLSHDINSTVATLKHYIDEAATRIDRELLFAKNIQHSAMPSVFPAFQNRKEFEIFASMDTAKEVGGDFYDFYMLGDDRLAFMIADVSGKGIPSAMFMMRSKTLLKSLAESGLSLEQVFINANNNLCQNNDAGMFVTAWMGILDVKTGHVEYVNAGHNPPLVYNKENGFVFIKEKSGFILGGMENMKYKVYHFDLARGDKLFLYTDGVTEATDKNKELFGEQRLCDYLNKNSFNNITGLVNGVKQQLDNFVGEEEQFDDITMLSMEYLGNMSEFTQKTYNATKNSFDSVNEFVESKLDEYQATPKSSMQINVAVEEIFVNICNYAYGSSGGDFSLGIGCENDLMTLQFIDKGVMFNPLERKDPDTTLTAEERNIGGLGIFMVKKTMDSVKYNYIDGQNILTITKKIK